MERFLRWIFRALSEGCGLTYCAALVFCFFVSVALMHVVWCLVLGMSTTACSCPVLLMCTLLLSSVACSSLSMLMCALDLSTSWAWSRLQSFYFRTLVFLALLWPCAIPALSTATCVPYCCACPHRNPLATLPVTPGYVSTTLGLFLPRPPPTVAFPSIAAERNRWARG